MDRKRLLLGYALAIGFVCSGAATVLAASPGYTLLTTIPITTDPLNTQPGGIFSSFDISFFDPSTRLDYVADRSNAAVDVFSGVTVSQVGQITGGFTGQAATTSASGPDGVVVANANGIHTLFAGNGNSTLVAFNLATSTTSPPALSFSPVSTGGKLRVDEMAYSPTTNLLLVANNADSPAFGTLINATTGAIVHANIVIPGAAPSDGLEQPIWNPNTKSFYISVPSFAGDAGGIAEIKTDGTVGQIIKFSAFGITSCSPTGLAIGGSGNLLVGCGNAGTQTVLVNLKAGTATAIAGISASDELYYDPTLKEYFVTGSNGTARVFDVIADDATGSVLQSVLIPDIASTVNAHSISVDPGNGDVYLPLPGGVANTLCAKGCVAVFAPVPEPSSTALLLPALGVLGWLGLRRRRS